MVNSGYKISIALCTYDDGQHLPAQLDSIATQNRLPDELVACDDKSNDGTVEISNRFAHLCSMSESVKAANFVPGKNLRLLWRVITEFLAPNRQSGPNGI